MTEQQVRDEVLRYIDDSSYNYAILIDGEWGSGKTYFISNILSHEIEEREKGKDNPRTIKYVSLYGCKTMHDVQENIAWTFAENARDKIKDKANWGTKGENISNNILLSSKKIGNAILKKFMPETSLYEIASDWLNLGAFIFIFDDLERCDCSLNEVFGFLNELVEHENTKVIIVANEKEISGVAEPKYLELQYQISLDERIQWPNDEQRGCRRGTTTTSLISINELDRRRKLLFPQKDANVNYKKIREKLIGTTLRYEPNVLPILTKIIQDSQYSEEIKELLLEKVKMFSATMDYYHHHNLRTFQFFLSKVSYLLDRFAEIEFDEEYRRNILNHIISETFSLAVKLKANYQPKRENSLGLGNEQDAVSTTIKNYVDKGEFIFDIFKKDVLTIQEELKASIPKDDAYYLLYQQYYFHTQEWCEAQLEIILNQLQNCRYPVSFYGKIIIATQRLMDLGFDVQYMQRIKEAMKTGISTMGEINPIDEDLWMIDDIRFKEKVRTIIREINDVIIEHSVEASYITVKDLLEAEDWLDKLEKYSNPDNSYSTRDVPVFSKAEIDQWINKLHLANPEEIDDFRHWLARAYPTNQCRESYVQDAVSIKEIKQRLEELEEHDLIKKACTGWLISQIDQIIRCNEPEVENVINEDIAENV